jgi:ABC-2 type transport system permease protein
MRQLILLELRQLLRDRSALIILAMLCIACAVALLSGRALLQQHADARALAQTSVADARAEMAGQVAQQAAPSAALLYPFRVREGILAPLPLLIDFSAGRSRFENYAAEVSLRSRADTLFKRPQLTNPELSVRGTFDLGFVAVVIAPLLLIGLGYGLFSADRDSGAARLVLVQAGSPVRLIIARSVPRFLLVALPLVLTALLLLALGPGESQRVTAAALWLILALLLLLLWWLFIVLANTLRANAETTALGLVAAWAFFTLVLPPLISAAGQLLHPPPSRFEQIALARVAEVQATSAYENDHADLAEDAFEERLASLRKSVSIGQAVDSALEPLSARFDLQLQRQQALERSFAWLSPPLMASEAMITLAGTGTVQSSDFRHASAAFLANLKAELATFIENGAIMRPGDLESLPRFQWSPRRPFPVTALVTLCLLTVALGFICARRLRRVSVE